MELLWPGLPIKSAQVNLRQTIYQLRKAIPPKLEGGNEVSLIQAEYRSVALNPAYPIEVDTHRFNERLSLAQSHEHSHLLNCEPCLELLKEGAALYRGPFLADFWLDDSDLFEDWALGQRESYCRQVLDALDTLTTTSLRGGAKLLLERVKRSFSPLSVPYTNIHDGLRPTLFLAPPTSRRGQAAE